jgi:hypothetical protein
MLPAEMERELREARVLTEGNGEKGGEMTNLRFEISKKTVRLHLESKPTMSESLKVMNWETLVR